MCRPISGKHHFYQRRIHVKIVEFVSLGRFSKSLITPAPGAKWPGILLSRSAAKSLCFSVQDMGRFTHIGSKDMDKHRQPEAKTWRYTTHHHQPKQPTVDGRNPASPEMYKTVVNNGILPYQLIIAGFLNHEQYDGNPPLSQTFWNWCDVNWHHALWLEVSHN